MKIYTEIPDMEILAGDTAPTVHFTVTGTSLSGLTASASIVSVSKPNTVLKTAACTATEDGFDLTIPAADTAGLDGDYYVDVTISGTGIKYKRIRGLLIVRKSARGA